MKRLVGTALTWTCCLLLLAYSMPALAQDAAAAGEASDDVTAVAAVETDGRVADAPAEDSADEDSADDRATEQDGEQPQPGFLESLSGGKAAVNLRYRFETVDQDNFDLNGQASTLRTALSYGTLPYRGFRLFLQAENVVDVGLKNAHNNAGAGDSNNGVLDRPVIADPPGTEMLQAYIEYAGGGSAVQLGRQVVNLDDQRFVGAVGWRQHWQTLDSVRFRNDRLDNFVFNYIYVDRVNRIVRNSADTSSHLINAQYKFAGYGALTGYGYLLRYHDDQFAGLSRDTVGVEFKGSRPAGSVTLHYEAEYAHQADAGDNPHRVSSSYVHLAGGVGYEGFTLRAGWERIGGSRTDGQFQFTLGTNHAFNGWVDKFLSTPTHGLSDLMFRLDGPLGPVRWQVRYHTFNSVTDSKHYGSEWDMQASYVTDWKQTFAIKAGFYNADEFSVDTSKIWLWTAFAF